jgi:hypothetical protein
MGVGLYDMSGNVSNGWRISGTRITKRTDGWLLCGEADRFEGSVSCPEEISLPPTLKGSHPIVSSR